MKIPDDVILAGYRRWLFAGDGLHQMGEYDAAAVQEDAYWTAFHDGADWRERAAND